MAPCCLMLPHVAVGIDGLWFNLWWLDDAWCMANTVAHRHNSSKVRRFHCQQGLEWAELWRSQLRVLLGYFGFLWWHCNGARRGSSLAQDSSSSWELEGYRMITPLSAPENHLWTSTPGAMPITFSGISTVIGAAESRSSSSNPPELSEHAL